MFLEAFLEIPLRAKIILSLSTNDDVVDRFFWATNSVRRYKSAVSLSNFSRID